MRELVAWVVAAAAVLVAAAPPAAAHPGRTNASGCHTCRTNCSKWGLSTGQYHCHGGGRRSASSRITKPPPPPAKPSAPVRVLRKEELPDDAPRPENSIVTLRTPPPPPLPRAQIEVVAVVAGDTLVARQGEGLYLLQLRDIEAPELDQPYGEEARGRLATEVAGHRIVVTLEKTDGCVVPVRAAAPDGTDVAERLLSEGLVWARLSAPDPWRRLEAQARERGVGLWADSAPEPPWEYRRRRIDSTAAPP